MKAIAPIIALMAAPVLMTSAHAAAGALEGYLPTDGTMKAGVAVAPQFSPEFVKMQQDLAAIGNLIDKMYRCAGNLHAVGQCLLMDTKSIVALATERRDQ